MAAALKVAVGAGLAALVCAALAGGAPARSKECETAGKVCLGTLPSSHKRVILTSRNGSAERGIASVILGFHETRVTFRLSGAPQGVRQSVRILSGGCGGKVLSRLGTIVDGKGVARANPMSHLSGFAIAVHATTQAGAPIVACGAVPPYKTRR